jgi:UMF1 family MFS transporter
MADMATSESKVNGSTGLSAKELINAMSDDDKKALKGWYFFDWANQAYALTVMTVIAPALMASLYNKATGTQSGDAFYAFVLTFSMIFVVITAPALGVIADRFPIKKKLLKWYTIVGIVFTALMGAAPYFGSQGYIFLAMIFTIGTIGFTGGNVIYYSFMPFMADRKCQDHVSTWGYMYGFMGGSMLLVFHLIMLLGNFWDTNFTLAVIFVTSALWWLGFGMVMFKWTPEPEISSNHEWEGFAKTAKSAYGQVFTTLKEIRKFKVLALFLFAYLLFYDGVNTIASMAAAFGESVLRLDPSMNIMLLLTVNVVAIPMTFVFGKLADKKGTKFALVLALLIYCVVSVTAAGFTPLELEGEQDAERFDFQFEFDETTGNYTLTTLQNRGYEGWINNDSAGDAAFRDAFQENFPETDYSVEDSGSSTLMKGLFVVLVILGILAILGSGIIWIQQQDKGFLQGWKGILAAFLLVGVGIFGASLMADSASTADAEKVDSITQQQAIDLEASFNETSDHRWSIIIIGGDESIAGSFEIGDTHPSILDPDENPVDGWAAVMRDNVWEPLGIGVSMQWIILGLFVGCAMGSAGAQARSVFSQLTPKSRTSEFFGFFGFLGKSAAMIGTFLYGIASSTFDSRVAILTITIVILIGTFMVTRIDMEEGIRVAEEEDARALAEVENSN